MDMFLRMVEVQVVLFLYLLVGVYARKREIINEHSLGKFVDFLMVIVLPCTVFASFDQELTPQTIADATTCLVISLGICVVSYLAGMVLFRRAPASQRSVMQYGTLISNASFAGLPIVESVFGPQALFFASIFLIPLRIAIWTAGISFYTVAPLKTKIKQIFLNPCLIAAELGMIRMIFAIHIPGPANTAIQNIGSISTAMSIIIVGAILADVNIRTVFSRNVLWLSFVRLIMLPLLVLAVLRLLDIDPLITSVCVMLTSMPVGATTAILAQKYGADYEFGSKSVFVTTALCLVTLPLISLLL